MTQHAAALTYYALMSLFPAVLLGISLLALIGQYPSTYDSILNYLRDVAPQSAVAPIDDSLRTAFRHKDTATTAVVLSIAVALYGTTGVLEAARRALNVVFRSSDGRSFWRRKAIDIAFTFVLGALVLATLHPSLFVGGQFADDLFGFIGLGSTRGEGVEHRALARRAGGDDPDLRPGLLRHAGRQAPLVQVDHARSDGRRDGVARRLGRVLRVPLEFRERRTRSTARSGARSCSSAGYG